MIGLCDLEKNYKINFTPFYSPEKPSRRESGGRVEPQTRCDALLNFLFLNLLPSLRLILCPMSCPPPTRKQPPGQPAKLLPQQPGALLLRLLQKVAAYVERLLVPGQHYI